MPKRTYANFYVKSSATFCNKGDKIKWNASEPTRNVQSLVHREDGERGSRCVMDVFKVIHCVGPDAAAIRLARPQIDTLLASPYITPAAHQYITFCSYLPSYIKAFFDINRESNAQIFLSDGLDKQDNS